jgi:hypothetical protein
MSTTTLDRQLLIVGDVLGMAFQIACQEQGVAEKFYTALRETTTPADKEAYATTLAPLEAYLFRTAGIAQRAFALASLCNGGRNDGRMTTSVIQTLSTHENGLKAVAALPAWIARSLDMIRGDMVKLATDVAALAATITETAALETVLGCPALDGLLKRASWGRVCEKMQAADEFQQFVRGADDAALAVFDVPVATRADEKE